MNKHYLLTIRAEDRPGLLHLVTGIINRKLISIKSLTAARTDISDIVLISVELSISDKALTPLVLKLENIIEVYAIDTVLMDKAIITRSAYFKLDKAILASPQRELIARHGLQMMNIDQTTILVSKAGNSEDLQRIYQALEGPYLLGFSQTGLIADSKLIAEEQSSVISGLAA